MMNKYLSRIVAALILIVAPSAAWPVFDPVNDDTDIFLANPAYYVSPSECIDICRQLRKLEFDFQRNNQVCGR